MTKSSFYFLLFMKIIVETKQLSNFFSLICPLLRPEVIKESQNSKWQILVTMYFAQISNRDIS